MTRQPWYPQLLAGTGTWTGVRWVAELHIDSRCNVASVNMTAYVKDTAGGEQCGYESAIPAPFGDLRAVLTDLLIGAAIDATNDAVPTIQVELPFDPFTR